MSKLMVKVDDIWVPMEGLKGDTGPLPADESIPDTALVTDGAKTNTAYLMGNRLIKDAEGELISVEDAYAVPPVSVNFDGVLSTQVTTTGKNLLSDVTAEWVSATLDGTNYRCTFIPVADGASYFYHREAGTTSLAAGWVNEMDGTGFVAIASMSGHNSGYTFTNSDNHAYLVFYYASSTTAAAAAKAMSDNKIQVEAGTSYSGYEKYTGRAASPSPDYPQEITSITELKLKTCAKNFVPSDDPENPNANYTFNSGKRVMWDSEREGFRLTDSGIGVATAAHASRNPVCAFIAPKDGVYTFGVDTKYYTSGTAYGFRANLNSNVLNGYGWGASSTETEWTRHSVTRTLSKGDRFGATIYQTCLWRNISVVEGSEDIYQPYSGVTASLDLSEEPLRSLPDGTKDELHLTYIRPSTREGWAWYSRELEQRITTKIFDGSESWILYSPYAFYKAMPGARVMKTGRKELLCDQYKSASSDTLGSARTGATLPNTIFGRNTERHAIIKTETRYDTVGDFTASLAENPIIIQYALATPQIIDLGEIELPIMQAGTTNIWSDPSTNLSVTYERDRNIVITNLKAAVADLATS